MGEELGLDEVRIEHVSIVVAELASNLLKHAAAAVNLFENHTK
jgi:anti-sigma regulatory factor (Ser/Thr protein kinase)